jgi:hypothetical protein
MIVIIGRSINQSNKTAASINSAYISWLLNLPKLTAVSLFVIISRSINQSTKQQHQLNSAFISWLLTLSKLKAVQWFVIISLSINQSTKQQYHSAYISWLLKLSKLTTVLRIRRIRNKNASLFRIRLRILTIYKIWRKLRKNFDILSFLMIYYLSDNIFFFIWHKNFQEGSGSVINWHPGFGSVSQDYGLGRRKILFKDPQHWPTAIVF